MTIQTPDAAQIRAALSLLLWENDDLARLCSVTPQTVSNIKRGTTRAQPRILDAMRQVFENSGIEFLDHSGVRLKPEGVEILQGHDGFLKLFELILNKLGHHGGQVCVSGVDEKLFVKHQGTFAQPYMNHMALLVKKRKDIQMKIIVREGDKNFVASNYASYRWQSTESFSPTPFYVFADYLALISFQGENAPKVIIIHSAIFAEAYKKQFMGQWKVAKTPPHI